MTMINNIKRISAALAVLCCVSSCNSDFLQIYPETSLNEGNFYKSDEDLVALVNGCYIALRDMEKRDHWNISELKSDVLIQQRSSSAGDFNTARLDEVNAGSDNISLTNFWNISYRGVYNCNKALSVLESNVYEWTNQALKNRSVGEVRFLRALYYFNLVRQYGGVPLVTQPVTGAEAVDIKRASVQDVYDLIISDLQAAQTAFAQAQAVHANGRASLEAANGLLGKVYLTLRDYDSALAQLKKVIDSGKHRLLDDYAEVFNPARKDFVETIFSVQYSEAAADLSNQYIFFNAPYRSQGEVTKRPNIALSLAGNMAPSTELIRAFSDGDKRKDVSIAFWYGLDWDNEMRNLPYCAKYKSPQTAALNWCGDNFPILRYSDILLMYAEALNLSGRTAEAVPYVQMVRQRAGLNNDLSTLSQSELDRLIEDERMREFCFENQRWYDLVRRGRAVEVMRAQGKDMAEIQLLAAIPSEQILINKLDQNPGY